MVRELNLSQGVVEKKTTIPILSNVLVEADKDLSILTLSGSPIIGSFDFRTRVDFVRVPGVIKLRNGEYTSLNLHLHIEDTLRLRASI